MATRSSHPVRQRDAKHKEIWEAVRGATWALDIHNHADGIGDILARHVVTGQPVFLEVKNTKSDKLTESEQRFAAAFKAVGAWVCVHSIEEALAAIGVHSRR